MRACTSFDFQPGSRIASFSGSAEYEESTCYLTREQPAPEGIGILMLVPNSVHFTEVCLSCEYALNYRYICSKGDKIYIFLSNVSMKLIDQNANAPVDDMCLNGTRERNSSCQCLISKKWVLNWFLNINQTHNCIYQ